VLVLIGVRADGAKELVAFKGGYRESAESWADLMRDCARRGIRAPVLAVGDGALGFWKALAEVFPETRQQRCWVHKTANVLDSMPKSEQPGAQKAIQDIYNAEVRDHAIKAIKTFAQLYGAKFSKAVRKIADGQEQLLACYGFPAEHWIHLRTTNPTESTFSTVRLRTEVTRGAGSRTAALAMVFKLVESAQQRWRAVNATPPRRPRPRRSEIRARSPRRADWRCGCLMPRFSCRGPSWDQRDRPTCRRVRGEATGGAASARRRIARAGGAVLLDRWRPVEGRGCLGC
jgi:transposase-like protein